MEKKSNFFKLVLWKKQLIKIIRKELQIYKIRNNKEAIIIATKKILKINETMITAITTLCKYPLKL